MTQPAPQLDRFTDMTFNLLRCEITDIIRTMADERRHTANMAKSFSEMTLLERDTWIQSCEQYLNQRYVRHCSPSDPLQWVCSILLPYKSFFNAYQVTSLLASILTRKLRLHIHNPLQRHAVLSEEDRERLFHIAVETIEMTHKLRTDLRIQKWHWFFSSYNQWHALAYAIYYLYLYPLGRTANRAWRAVEEMVVLRWNVMSSGVRTDAHQWRRILKMLDSAKLQRRQALQSLKAGQRNVPPLSSSSDLTTDRRKQLAVEPRSPEASDATLAPPLPSAMQAASDGQFRFGDTNPFLDQDHSLADATQFPPFEIPEDRFEPNDTAEVDIDVIMGYRYDC